MIRDQIQDSLKNTDVGEMELEHPEDIAHGDFASSVALKRASQEGGNPREIAQDIVASLEEELPSSIEKVEIAGPGFINLFLSADILRDEVDAIRSKGSEYGYIGGEESEKIIIEYTDPNPFKVFHIGHLMSNTIGESLSRLLEFSGAEVLRANYQGDVGMHIAMAVWGVRQLEDEMPAGSDSLEKRVDFLGRAYAHGAKLYEENDEIRTEIEAVNKKIYEGGDEEITNLYTWGREISLEKFEYLYQILGTKFDKYFFESEVADAGKEVVLEGLERDIFERSEGAVVYRGEKDGLHTRVFVNSQGIPTYEAKELALAREKYEWVEYDRSIVVTANEINEYFKVVLSAMSKLFPDLAMRTEHVSHGFLRLPTGKMSSRTGNIISGEELLEEVIARTEAKMSDRDIPNDERELIARKVAVAAIKYSILKQSAGSDIVFDIEKSLSFEGDSGPYLQYTYVRTQSVLEKARNEGYEIGGEAVGEVTEVERMLYRFPEIVERSLHERSPHYVIRYLTDLASCFNSYYGSTQIVSDEEGVGYRLALTDAVGVVLKNGLYLLGIETVDRM
ncbi:MAG: arginine--tRNA ligase [Candidatus Paceibacterota bacterium]